MASRFRRSDTRKLGTLAPATRAFRRALARTSEGRSRWFARSVSASSLDTVSTTTGNTLLRMTSVFSRPVSVCIPRSRTFRN